MNLAKFPSVAAALSLAIVAMVGIAPGAAVEGSHDVMTNSGQALSNDEIREFCSNIADAARERRYALKAAELRKLQEKVEQRIALLEEKSAEFEKWVSRRDAFMQKANESLVEIYAKMRPDAAAARLELLGIDLAAVILMKLTPRQAGVILNEMDAAKAASVTGIMSATAKSRDPS